MLNLWTNLKLKEKNKVKKSKLLITAGFEQKKTTKHFPCSTREWNNSIYVYNKNTLNLTPSTAVIAINLIKSYFSLYNKHLESKMRTKRLSIRKRRKSSNKFYIGIGGFKHTNNKVLINLFAYNRQKINYLLRLKKWYIKTFMKKTSININTNIIKKLKLINSMGLQAFKTVNNDKYLLIKALNNVNNNNNFNMNTFRYLSKYLNNFYTDLIKKSLKKLRMYFYYKQLLYINKSKLNYTYLRYLKKHLERLYNKNVEFNIINLKRFYLNSDILSESVAVKTSRKRSKINRYLRKLRNKINVQKKKIFLGYAESSAISKKLNTKEILFWKQAGKSLQKHVINKLKYRHVTGFRLEAKGRLTRRYTASRSVHKLKYNGNLINIDSSYRGLSSVLLKGNLKSNTQYTKLSKKTRIGSFGIKGWVSGN